MYGVWLTKQASGWCATRVNMARIQDLLDDKCPNYQTTQETASHLNQCPDEGRTQLFNEGAEHHTKWLHQDNRTDPELTYWIPKYLLLCGTSSFALVGTMLPGLQRPAESQNMIG